MGCINSHGAEASAAGAQDMQQRQWEQDTLLAMALSQEDQHLDPEAAAVLLQSEEDAQLALALAQSLAQESDTAGLSSPAMLPSAPTPDSERDEQERLRAIAQADHEQVRLTMVA
eukprot:gb/GFBE01059644.1/.p1 GENE.gb/GFBE01059644.1/~~gb/GFBE01059644.1/.p1  ORF type:complete len:115 (+),score=30.96 gb/GFBE01059644.1/:1-345(+)